MSSAVRFSGMTVQVFAPDPEAALDFYSTLFGAPPDFQANDDFWEWEVFDGLRFQLGSGKSRPTYPVRFLVVDIDSACISAEKELGVRCSPVKRIKGLVALCNFTDPWGNNLGFYQRLFVDGKPRKLGGTHAQYNSVE